MICLIFIHPTYSWKGNLPRSSETIMSALGESFICRMSPGMRVTSRSRHTSLTCAASTTTALGFFSTAITCENKLMWYKVPLKNKVNIKSSRWYRCVQMKWQLWIKCTYVCVQSSVLFGHWCKSDIFLHDYNVGSCPQFVTLNR